MKKYLILVIVFICTRTHAEKIPCYVIKNNGDTVNLTLKVSIYSFFKYDTEELAYRPNIIPLQRRIICYNSKKIKYVIYPSQIKEFGFTCDNIEYRFLSRVNNWKINRYTEPIVRRDNDGLLTLKRDSCAFLLIEMDGYLKLYTAFISKITSDGRPGMPSHIYFVERHFLEKGNEGLKMVDPLFFKNDMVHYFSDCPELADRITNRELRKDDLYEIVNFYNRWIQNKQ